MTLKQLENKTARRQPVARGHNFPDVWLGLQGISARLDGMTQRYEGALAERDQRIMELQGITSNQAVVIDQLVAARERLQVELEGVAARFGELDLQIEARAEALDQTMTERVLMVRRDVQANMDTLVENSGQALEEQRLALEGEIAARVAVDRTVEGLVLQVANVDQAHQALEDTVTDAGARADDWRLATAEALQVDRTAAAARFEELRLEAVGVGARLEAVSDNVSGILEGCANVSTAIAGQVEALGSILERVTDTEATVSALVREGEVRDQAAAQLELLVTSEKEAVRSIVDDMVTNVAEQFRGLQVDSRAWISKLPKNLIVDSKGDLVAVTGEGDLQIVGRVVGAPGLDGATLEGVEIVEGHLVAVMTDGRRLDAGKIPLAPAGEPVEATKQARAQDLHAAGVAATKIAEILDVSRRTVSRWVKGNS